MSKLLKLFSSILVFSLLILLTGYIAFLGWLQSEITQTNSHTDKDYPYTKDTTNLRYQVGSQRFNIPLNYNMGKKPGTAFTEIFKTPSPPAMRAIWPNLKPYSKETQAEYKKPGWQNKFSIAIEKTHWYQPKSKFDPSISPASRNQGAYSPEQLFYYRINKRKRQGIKGTYDHDTKIPAEFIYYPYKKGRDEKKEIYHNIYAVLDHGQYIYSVMCAGSKAAPHPACRGFFKYSNEIKVQYVFSLNLLKHWRQIEPKIRNLVASFEQAASQEK